MRKIEVIPCLNGWIVRVGCQTVIFTDIDLMCAAFKEYAADPAAVEKIWLENAKNKNLQLDPCCEPCCDQCEPAVECCDYYGDKGK